MMKLLLISPLPPTVGGISVFAGNLIDYLKLNPNGLNLILCNTADKNRSVVSESITIRLYTGIINSLRIFFEVRKILKKEKPQVIHLASSASLALIKDNLLIYLANHYKIPVITHWHFGRISSLANQNNWEWKLLCSAIRKSTHSIVIDGKSHKTLESAGFPNVFYIPNPIGLDFEKKAKTLIKNTHKRVQGRIIFVGHIIKSKGVYELVKACSQLPIIKELMLAGPHENNTEKELKVLANKRDGGIWLKFTGTLSRNEVLELMQNSSILALPSYTEGFPNVILEAMSMGCAVIATDVGAIPEMLAINSKSPCGICVPIQNIEKLKKAILNLTEDSKLTMTLSNNGIKQILNNYTLEKVVKQYYDVWESLVIK